MLPLDIKSVEKNDQYCTVNLILKNNHEYFIRLTNLNEQKNLQLLNREDLAAFSEGVDNDIRIPSKASGKVYFTFILERIPQKVRIYGVEFEFLQDVVKEDKIEEEKQINWK